jgi:hypothetical protein
MPVSHAAIPPPTPCSAMARLQEFFAGRRTAPPVTDLEAFEREMHDLFAAAECEAMAQEMARLDVDVPVILVEGVAHRRVVRCEETYFGAAGPVRIMRSLYSTRQDGERAVCPMELRGGVVEGRWTPLAARQAAWVVAHLTPQEGQDLFAMLGGMKPSKSSLDRLPKQLSERWEADRERFEEALRREELVPKEAASVAASLDGVMVPMKDGKREEKRARARTKGKLERGPAGYQEVGCATLSLYDADGERLKTIRMARMPEPKKATVKTILAAELTAVLAQRPDLAVVKLADGAKDNWEYLSELDPPSPQVLDFFHAAEHLKVALAAAYGETSALTHAQFEKQRLILRDDDNGIEKVIRSLAHLRDEYPGRKKIAKELRYFRNNRHRMRYARMKADNLPIGSGVMEAACKTLATQRLKRSGMRWRHDGGQAILTLRALAQSDRFDCAWQRIGATYKREVVLPDNVIALH